MINDEVLQARNPRFREYVEYKIGLNEFMKLIQFRIHDIQPGYTKGEMPFLKLHEQQNGYLHGGVSSTVLDMVQGFAAYSMVEEGQQVFTVEAKVSYLNRGTGSHYFAEGRVLKAGKRFHFCEGEIYFMENNQKVVVAKGSSTMAVV